VSITPDVINIGVFHGALMRMLVFYIGELGNQLRLKRKMKDDSYLNMLKIIGPVQKEDTCRWHYHNNSSR